MVKLNCDLGEGLDALDAQVMPFLQMANIACGAHAGDPQRLKKSLELAKAHAVTCGAHPGYPDRDTMGRRSLALSESALTDTLLSQLTLFQNLCHQTATTMAYIKPHGALYNDMMCDLHLFARVMNILASHCPGIPVLIQAMPSNQEHLRIATQLGQTLWFEGFADRAYSPSGRLEARSKPGAVHTDIGMIVKQARELTENGRVRATNGNWLEIEVDTLCVHSDTQNALTAVKQLHHYLDTHSEGPRV